MFVVTSTLQYFIYREIWAGTKNIQQEQKFNFPWDLSKNQTLLKLQGYFS
jgi:hypothetical protein